MRTVWRNGIAMAVLIAAAASLAASGFALWRDERLNAQLAAFATGHDRMLPRGTDPALHAARGVLLLSQGRVDDAQAELDTIGQHDPAAREILLYALANAHLRRAIEIFDSAPMRRVAPLIGLSKSEYRQVLLLNPDNWDARYNFDIASALAHDPEAASFLKGDDMARQHALVPDAPGAPNGLP